MIEVMDQSRGNIIGLHVTGKLHEKDYAEFLPKLEDLFTQYGKLRVLFFADPDFEGWDMSAAWQDASVGFRHAADFERLAVVGAPDWVEWCIRLSGFLFKGDVKIFPPDQLNDAWGWIQG